MAGTELDLNTLNWVKSEIDETMKQARNSLESYVEEQDDESQLRFCVNYLHQVFGTLQMVELYGASLLAEELEQLAIAILDNKVKNKNDAFEVMMRGMLQLPDYLEQLQAGYKDTPMVLMPLLNDIRAARSEPLLSETALFNPDLNVPAPTDKPDGNMMDKINDVARSLRQQYHLGLLGWFRNKQLDESFNRLAKVVHSIRQTAEEANTARMLWIAEGVIEGLKNKGIESTVAIKSLMGNVDRKIKEIIDNGEVALAMEPPAELLKNMLYYVAGSSAKGKLTDEIKSSFQLAEIMPDTKTLEKARADLAAPNAQLLDTVSGVMHDDLQQVQDLLDVFVRGEQQDVSQLAQVAEKLDQMSDTLGMLGLGPERNTMVKQVEILKAMANGDAEVDDAPLMEIASSMITLERTLSDLGSVKRAEALADSERKPIAETAEQRKLLESVISEAKVDINRVKEAISDFSKQPNHPELVNDVPALMDKVRGSLKILNLERAAELMSQCRDYVEYEVIPLDKIPDTQMLDYLADAISSIEYYMESLIDSWGEPSAILDVAETSLSHLIEEHSQSLHLHPQGGDEASSEVDMDNDITAIDLEQPSEPAADSEPDLDLAGVVIEDDEDEPDTLVDIEQPDLKAAEAEADRSEAGDEDESLELTLDNLELPDSLVMEAGEEDSMEITAEIPVPEEKLELDSDDLSDVPASTHIERLDEAMGLWVGDPQNKDVSGLLHDVLMSIEQHTRAIGNDKALKVCKDMQNIITRVTQGDESFSEDTQNTLVWARDTLNTEFAAGVKSPAEPESVAESIPEPAAESAPAETKKPATPVTPPAESSPVEEIDEEIFEIFLEEAEEESQNIARLLPVWINNTADQEPLTEMRRSFHTLKGSGRLVGAAEVGEFAWAFENMLNRVIDGTVIPDDEMFTVLNAAKDNLPYMFTCLKQGERAEQHIFTLMEQANALSRGESVAVESQQAEPAADHETEPESSSASLQDIGEPSLNELSNQTIPDIDPALKDIYKKEVATHLQALRDYIADWKENRSRDASTQLYRALHTLTGSARTTGVASVSELCSKLENYTRCLQKLEEPVDENGLGLIEECANVINDVCQQLDTPGAVIPDTSVLITKIEDATRPLEQRLQQQQQQLEQPASSQEDEYDEELLEIFVEEGTEILDESDQTLHEWQADPENMEHVESLQRQLHTLKGGARMSGVKEMGDLSHRVESVLTGVVDDLLQTSPEMFVLLLKAQDRLVDMLDKVRGLQHPEAADDINAELDVMLGKPVSTVKPQAVPQQPESTDHVDVETPSLDEADSEIPLKPVDEHETIELSRPDVPLHDTTDEKILDEPIEVSDIVEDAGEDTQVELTLDTDEITPDSAEAQDNAISLPITPIEDQSDALTDTGTDTSEPAVEAMPAEATSKAPAAKTAAEQVRIRADLLDNLVNFAGEVSIYRSRLEQQSNTYRSNLVELDDTVSRLRDQLRKFDIEAEAQISHRKEEAMTLHDDFDPLEFDRFTQMQQLSRSMMESMNDIESLRSIFSNITRESETLLLQQSRITSELQEGLLRTRMIPFSGQTARLRRIVRQTSAELDKPVELELEGTDNEIDRTIVERIMPSVEHMLRNAIAHGIEDTQTRKDNGKPETGTVKMGLSREGSDIILTIEDDGAGIDFDAIREKAISKGLIKADQATSQDDLLDMILESGFSTADKVSQIAGRGVGMDVVSNDIKQMGGLLNIQTEPGKGTRFTVSMPLTLAVTRALMVNVGEEQFALPLLSVEGVERIDHDILVELQQQENPVYSWIGEDFNYINLGKAMGLSENVAPAPDARAPLLMVRSGEFRAAIHIDSLVGSREIVVKPVGPQISTVRGISGATIMGDGSVILVLDLGVLIRLALSREEHAVTHDESIQAVEEVEEEHIPVIMVVDDSITVRKVTTRFLERNDFKTAQAKDGVDALQQLIDLKPDVMLLDVEMPRMDGFELATNIRNAEDLKDIPIIMITSRTGEKHRQRAMDIGVNHYMGKPYNEAELLENIQSLLDI